MESLLFFLIKPHDPQVEHAACERIRMGLKLGGDAFFTMPQSFGQRILDIEKLGGMDFERLRRDLLATDQDIKDALPAFATPVGALQGWQPVLLTPPFIEGLLV